MAGELAREGYAALAVDLYEGKSTSSRDEAEQLRKAVDPASATDTLVSWVGWLAHPADNMAMADLDVLLREIISQSDRPSDMHRRIELCRQALASLTRDRDPPLWAALQLALGKSPRQDPRDERADNLERAIEHLGAALTVYTREAFPELWAITQNNLGLAYAERIRGERVDNLERAIEHYHQALTIREGFPEPWDRRLRHLSKRRQENAGRTCRITSNRPGCSPASR